MRVFPARKQQIMLLEQRPSKPLTPGLPLHSSGALIGAPASFWPELGEEKPGIPS